MAKKTDIRLRRSNVANAIPGAANLSDGELAMNTMDGALYFKKSNGTIITAHDNTIMHIDSQNNRVGINKTNPNYRLDVSGNIHSTAAYIDGYIYHTGDTDTYLQYSTDTIILSAGAQQTYFKGNGRVGLGISSPTEKLHVTSGTVNTAVARFTGANNDRGLVISTAVSGVTNDSIINYDAVSTNSVGQHVFKTDGTERVRIDANGRLGIKNSSPSSQYFNTLVVGDTSGEHGITIQSSATSRGVLAFSDTNSATAGRYDGYIAYNHNSTYMSFHTNTGNEHMRIDSSGKVGIGTTSPDALLHLSANTGATLRLESTDTAIAADEVMGAIEWEGNDATVGSSGIAGKIDVITEDATPEYSMRFFTQDNLSGTYQLAERMRIKSDGKVGIGTSSPSFKLHVDSGTTDIAAQFKSSDNKAAILISDDDSNTYVSAEGSTSSIGVNAGRHANNLNILSTGAVGIGETSPDGKLHIKGGTATGDASHILFENTQGSKVFAIGGGSTGVTNNNLFFRNVTDNTRPMVITDAGNVGIGIDSPGSILHISNASSPEIRLEDSDATSTFNITTIQNASGALNFNTREDDGTFVSTDYQIFKNAAGANIHKWFIGNSEKVRITDGGYLLVGKTDTSFTTNGTEIRGGNLGARIIRQNAEPLTLHRQASDGDIQTFYKDSTKVLGIGVSGDRIYFAGANEAVAIDDSWNAFIPVNTGGGNSDNDTDLGNPSSRFKDLYLSGVATAAGFQNNVSTTGFGYVNFGDTDDANIGQIGYDHTDNYMRFQVNNTEKVRIIANGNVGIGTTSPTHKLHVTGTGKFDGALTVVVSSGGGAALSINHSGNENWSFDARSGSGSMDYVDFGIAGGTRCMTWQEDGNVGIGNTNPGVPLDVNSNSSAQGIRVRGRSSDDIGQIDLANNGGTVRSQLQWNNSFFNIKALAAIPMIFYTNSTERMRIQSAGEVGIGTTSPDTKLDVTSDGVQGIILNQDTGNSSASGRVFFKSAQRTNTILNVSGNLEFRTGATIGSSSGTVRMTIVGSSGAIKFNNAYTFPTSDGSAGQVLKTDGSGNLSFANDAGGGSATVLTDNDGDTKIQVEESADEDIIRFDIAGTQKMLLNSTELNLTGDLAVSGNLNIVGDINSTSVTNLDVTDKTITMANNSGSSTAADGAGIIIEGPTNNASLLWDHANQYLEFNKEVFSPAGFVIGTTGTKVGKMYNSSGVMALEAYTDRQISFGNADNGEHVRIDANGKVGIGDTAPQDYLEINGSGKGLGGLTISNSTHNHAALSFARSSTATARIFITEPEATHTSQMYFQTSDASGSAPNLVTAMSIDENQKVGIGTDAPSKRLHIKDSAAHQLQLQGSNSYWNVGTGWSGYYQDYLLFATNTGEKMVIDTNGSVGIGTNGPGAKLHIVQNSTSSDALLLQSSEDSSSAAPILAFKRNSASVADADYLGQLKFKGENDADQEVVYAKITSKILDASDGSEDGLIEFANRKAGSNVITARLRSDSLQLLNDTSLALKSDGAQLQFGNDNDMQMYHNGSAGEINNGTGDFTIDSVGDIILDADGGDVTLLDNGTQYAKFTNFLGGLAITSGGTNALVIGGTDGSMIMGGNVSLGDNKRLELGDGDDLLLYHNGSDSYIQDSGTGVLAILSNETRIQNSGGTENCAKFTENGAVTLFYDNNPKLATKADGVDITGELQSDSLDVDGNANISGNLVVTGQDHTFYSAAADVDFSIGRDANQALHINVSDGNIRLLADQDSDENGQHDFILDRTFDGTGQNNFKIRKGGSDQFVINKDGDVGIGTTSPAKRLHVVSAANQIRIEDSTNNKKYDLNVDGDKFMIDDMTAGANRLAISGANVGIGTTSPARALHIGGAGHLLFERGGEVRSKDTSGNEKTIARVNGSNELEYGWSGSGPVKFMGGGSYSERMRVHTNGNIAINQTAAPHTLTVKGTISRVNSSGIQIINLQSNSDAGQIAINNSGGTQKVKLDSAGDSWFTGGSVGIGITPGAKLHVNSSTTIGWSNLANAHILAGTTTAGIGFDNNEIMAKGSGHLYFGTGDSGDNVVIRAGGTTAAMTISGSNQRVGIANGTPLARFQVEEYGIDTTGVTTTSTSQAAIHSFPITSFRSARFTIQITNTTDSTYHSTEILAIHDGTTANITEFGEVHTGSSVEATFDADVSSGNFRLLATPTSTNTMQFKVVCHSITV